MCAADLSRREKVRGLYRVARFRPALTAFIVLFSAFAAVLEGFGLTFIIPIIEAAQADPSTADDTFVQYFLRAYEFVGIPFTLGYLIAGVAVVMVTRYTSTFVVAWLRVALETYYVRDLQRRAFDSALDADVAYFDEEGSDDILNAIVTQAAQAGKVIQYFVKFFQQLLLCLMYLGIAFVLSPSLTVFTVVMLGGLTVLIRYVLEPGYTVGDRVAEANERIQENVQAGTQGIRDVKLFTMTDELYSRFSTHIDRYTEATVTLGRNEAAIDNFYNLSAAVLVFVLIYVAVVFTGLEFGALAVFLFAMYQLGPRVSMLNNYFYLFEGNLAHLIRTQEFLDELERHEEPEGGRSLSTLPMPIRFEEVSFAYEPGGPVLSDVSFEVEGDEFVAFVGQSGAGKSTVASLLARMYEPTGGRITADGVDIDEFDVVEWRSRVAVVRQDPFVFDDTVRYNVTIGNREATQAEIERACEIAHVTEFLNDLPNGYETELGDDGVRLSGGQRQRIALARALLKEADLLILDEATSDLDTGIEKRVHRAMEEMERDYAIVAIAHRLSTVRGADRIYTLEQGRIVEEGRHDELLDSGGTYAELYSMQ
ncbi:ABC transporter ATP-binding protein [Natronorarus salvus]|uniref:ABC transporter ATP-binding protein n=1 Tax=Natronorarus salvus TaxID=3117733 RepID=UPI002F26B5D8